MFFSIIQEVAYKYVRGMGFYFVFTNVVEVYNNRQQIKEKNMYELYDFVSKNIHELCEYELSCFVLSTTWVTTFPLIAIMGEAVTIDEKIWKTLMIFSWIALVVF